MATYVARPQTTCMVGCLCLCSAGPWAGLFLATHRRLLLQRTGLLPCEVQRAREARIRLRAARGLLVDSTSGPGLPAAPSDGSGVLAVAADGAHGGVTETKTTSAVEPAKPGEEPADGEEQANLGMNGEELATGGESKEVADAGDESTEVADAGDEPKEVADTR